VEQNKLFCCNLVFLAKMMKVVGKHGVFFCDAYALGEQ